MSDKVTVEEQDYFEPVSELAGNIEVTLNSKNAKLDAYVPISEQIVFSIGKSGRANRLTFNEPTAASIDNMIDALKSVRDQLEKIEEIESVDEDMDLTADYSDLDEEAKSLVKSIRSTIDDLSDSEEGVKIDQVVDSVDDGFEDEEIIDKIEKIKREGEIFEPKEDHLQTI